MSAFATKRTYGRHWFQDSYGRKADIGRRPLSDSRAIKADISNISGLKAGISSCTKQPRAANLLLAGYHDVREGRARPHQPRSIVIPLN